MWAIRALAAGGGFAVELHETCLDAAATFAGFNGLPTFALSMTWLDGPVCLQRASQMLWPKAKRASRLSKS